MWGRSVSRAPLLNLAPLIVAAVVGSGCASTGESTPPMDSDGGMLDAAPAQPPAPFGVGLIADPTLCEGGAPSAGPAPLRRISRVEYNHMVRDLLADTTHPADQFVSESPMSHGINFNTNTYTRVTSPLIPQQYLEAAEALAQTAVTSNLSSLVPCSSQGNDACAKQFIADFAGRAFRGPLDDAESASLFQLYSDTRAQFDFATGIQAVITATLTSPRFLFVLEFGQGAPSGPVVALSPYELATRLSLYLWRSLPDATLTQAVSAGQLSTPDQIEAQAMRMLADRKAEDALDDFTEQWMELENTAEVTKDTQFTTWNAQLAVDLKTETLVTARSLVLQDHGGLTDLLTSPTSCINNSDLATFYGVGSGGTGAKCLDQDGYTRTNVNPDPANPVRAGILTSGAVLATQAHTSLPSPVLRGKLVREQLLCDPVPPPPAGLNIGPPPSTVAAGTTTRDAFAAHLRGSACATCHDFMDPIGFGFGHFDATGAFQDTDKNGQTAGNFAAIDASGQINPMVSGDLSAKFDGAFDLVRQLAGSTQFQECFALEQFRYAFGRIESRADACSAQQAFRDFASNGLNIQKLLIAIVRSDAFRYRAGMTAGSACP
jgi:hypothetical protein